jgi:DNA-binding IclR family transcriptional regulator
MREARIDKGNQFAATLANGIAVLRAFDPAIPELGNGALVERTGLDPATVSRLAFTLVQLGLLDHDRKRRTYRIAPGVLRIGYPLLASMHIRQFARPFMTGLASAVRGTVGMGVRHQMEMVYVDAVVDHDGPNPMIDRGMPIPLMTSAMGSAWLGAASTTEREKALNLQRVRMPALHAKFAHQATMAVRELREKGYCWRIGYRLRDRVNVAAPFHRRVDGEIVVFNCTILARAGIPLEDEAARIGPQLLEMLRRIESAEGGDQG